jgi:hypothetical protein
MLRIKASPKAEKSQLRDEIGALCRKEVKLRYWRSSREKEVAKLA